ncbi:MAG: hypothetical protein Q8L29_03930 [archaeon]|nr:hypothetical protein [archaeon]
MKEVKFYATKEQIDRLTDILGGEEGSAEFDIGHEDEEGNRIVRVYDVFHRAGKSSVFLVAKKNNEGYHCRLQPTWDGSEHSEAERLNVVLQTHNYQLERGEDN